MDLPGISTPLVMVIILLAIILLLSLGAYLQKKLSKYKKSIALDSHRKGGARGEVRAKHYLLSHGFKILKEQAVSENQIIVDGEPHSFQLRADFIVKKNGKVSVVDAKSGDEGVEPTHCETRRQLLEYFVHYKVDSAYVYNSKNDTLHEIVFPIGSTDKKSFSIGLLILIVIVTELIVIVASGFLR